MTKITTIFLSMVALLMLISCSDKEVVQDESPITVLVTQGGSKEYFRVLADSVKKKYDIDLEFLTQTSSATSPLILQDLANGKMQADIVLAASKIPSGYLENICVDLLSSSHLTSIFNYNTVKECTARDGGVYQLPISSKLIGITYNASVMKEHGWSVPKTFQDMVNLKKKCEQAGVNFAVTDINLTGHGFNYLFHLMGSQWLSAIEGSEWIRGFNIGTLEVDKFREASEYFRRWAESGLFGTIVSKSTGGLNDLFRKSRSLFCISIINTPNMYDGSIFDEHGRQMNNPHKDVYKSMPWISEEGDNNCFTRYDNCWAMISNRLLADNCKDKLRKAFNVVEYMTSKPMREVIARQEQDAYFSVNDFVIDDTRLYSAFAEEVESGFLQPWYYNRFPISAIVTTGEVINSYLLNTCAAKGEIPDLLRQSAYDYHPDATYDDIFSTLEKAERDDSADALGHVDDTLNFSQTASLSAIAGALSMQKDIDAMPADSFPKGTKRSRLQVQVAMVPYAKSLRDVQPWVPVTVENAVLYPGTLSNSMAPAIIPLHCYDMLGIYMPGSLIKELMAKKFNPVDRAGKDNDGKPNFDEKRYGPYAYACVTKGNIRIEDSKEYLVCISESALQPEIYERLEKAGKVLTYGRNGRSVLGHPLEGFRLYFKTHDRVSKHDITWK